MKELRKQQSHGKIGEAAVSAKCWMHGIPAYNTAGLRANFAGSDLLIDTSDPRRKLLIQVKTGYSPGPDWVYMTQCSGEGELSTPKFVADFVVFVNLDKRAGIQHGHDGTLDFCHLHYFVLPRDQANALYLAALKREHARPLIKTGGVRKLGNLAVNVATTDMAPYADAWALIRLAGSAPTVEGAGMGVAPSRGEPRQLNGFDPASLLAAMRQQ
ncbi:MAG: hypothetical protein QM788_08010 [Roseateles sp.]|uniref:hypothetical protein n=1 Tax=Roseateles sp. TaxID=1971397 RepID=UPI0039E81B34